MDEKTKSKITFKDILELLKENNLVEEYDSDIKMEDIVIEYISYDSRDIKQNTFFACKGLNFKRQYFLEAIKKPVVAYMSDVIYIIDDIKVPYIKVRDIKKAMAIVAAMFYGYAFNKINLIGITGTKGKTTTTNYIKNILDEYVKSKTAYISTMYIYTGTTDEDNHLTTPESFDLYRYFYETYKNDIKYLTMEVSSQAYKVDRIYGVNFDVGVFLNISEDHISPVEHPSFEDYLNCKLELMKNCKIAVINSNSDYLDSILEASKNAEKLITFGDTNESDYYVKSLEKLEFGYKFIVVSEKFNFEKEYTIKIPGRFNVQNALAAITVAKSLNIDDDSIYKGIAQTEVQGRMTIFKKDKVTVIIDYAHNLLSFEKLFETIKLDYPDNKINIVFGCPGNKAYTRRKDLGTVSGRNADRIYLTADDPQAEKVEQICKDISTYIEEFKTNYTVIVDREVAVTLAVKEAITSNEPTVVILAGKGAETTQKVNSKLEPYKGDIQIVKDILQIK